MPWSLAPGVVDVERVSGGEPDVFAVALDVTSTAAAAAAAEAAFDRFERVDVLVNSAGASFKGTSRKCRPPKSNSSWRRT